VRESREAGVVLHIPSFLFNVLFTIRGIYLVVPLLYVEVEVIDGDRRPSQEAPTLKLSLKERVYQ
jgi:hypothetical protein